MKSKREEAFLLRFEGREDIGKEGLYENYFKKFGLDKSEVFECFNFLEEELCISVGILRPSDALSKLTAPPQKLNFLQLFFWQGWSEDFESEIYYRVTKQLKKHGTYDDWTKMKTLNDLVLAWCGQKPFLE